MEKVYVLNTSILNGTVTISTHPSVFATRELAEKAKDEVDRSNVNKHTFSIINEIHEADLYEEEKDVPILNKSTKQ